MIPLTNGFILKLTPGTFDIILGVSASCLSAAVIKHHDQKQFKEESIYFTLGSRGLEFIIAGKAWQ